MKAPVELGHSGAFWYRSEGIWSKIAGAASRSKTNRLFPERNDSWPGISRISADSKPLARRFKYIIPYNFTRLANGLESVFQRHRYSSRNFLLVRFDAFLGEVTLQGTSSTISKVVPAQWWRELKALKTHLRFSIALSLGSITQVCVRT